MRELLIAYAVCWILFPFHTAAYTIATQVYLANLLSEVLK